MKTFAHLVASTESLKSSSLPVMLRLSNEDDLRTFNDLFEKGEIAFVHDTILSQLKELLKTHNPSKKIGEDEFDQLISSHLQGVDIKSYGIWVYYPWNKRIVHILDEDEFITVRTNRNRNKITTEEQNVLKSKKIGIIGLSVGQSIAATLATERTCGEIRLADFDVAELSNLNRIRTGVSNLELNKAVIAAREIMEIDPFIKVKIFTDGLTDNNIDVFLQEDGCLDLLVEVCDGLDVKLKSRFEARKLKIPVVMDTNDRGMLDVERFDLEPGRSILHGKLDDFIDNGTITITDENRKKILMSILSYDLLSDRMKLSMTEIGKSINAWPQLASSVVLGGAITTEIARRILLNQHNQSGRFYVDLEEIFDNMAT
jgi:molybdopterin/thiamine biosynthesis adenylyltransferase